VEKRERDVRGSLSFFIVAVAVAVIAAPGASARAQGASSARAGVQIYYGGRGSGAGPAAPAEAYGYRLQDSSVTMAVGCDIAVPPVPTKCPVNGPTACGVLVPVQVGCVMTLIDPNAEYRRLDTPSGLDSNHWILRVPQLYQQLNSGPTVLVFRGGEAQTAVAKGSEAVPQPILIIPKAPRADQPVQAKAQAAPAPAAEPTPEGNPEVKPGAIPTVPVSPRAGSAGRLVASAK
jgi:hypothetical protein